MTVPLESHASRFDDLAGDDVECDPEYRTALGLVVECLHDQVGVLVVSRPDAVTSAGGGPT